MVELVMQFLSDSIFIIVDAMLFVFIIFFISGLCQKGPQKSGVIKGMEKMLSATEKGRIPNPPAVEDRQKIITQLFESKMRPYQISGRIGEVPPIYDHLKDLCKKMYDIAEPGRIRTIINKQIEYLDQLVKDEMKRNEEMLNYR